MRDTSITTADDKLCSGCGFPLGGSRLGIIGVPGTYHADCLPHASTAALLATARAEARREALEEAAKVADAHVAAMEKKLAKPGLSEFDEGLWASAHTEASYIATAIRALIEHESKHDSKEG